MRDDEPRQTASVWEADLGESGRKLTVDELAALESMHICHLLGRLVTDVEELGLHLASIEGRFDRLEQFLGQVDPVRYPRSAAPRLPPAPDALSGA
jgi:hypothetical protein